MSTLLILLIVLVAIIAEATDKHVKNIIAALTAIQLQNALSAAEQIKLIATLQAHTDSMDDLRATLNGCIDEIRSVQTYGLKLNK